MTNLRPLHDYVLVRPDKAPEKIGSIIVPDRAKEKPLRGEVLAVGPGRVTETGRKTLDVAVGNVVLFSAYAGQKVENDDLLLHESDILAVEEVA